MIILTRKDHINSSSRAKTNTILGRREYDLGHGLLLVSCILEESNVKCILQSTGPFVANSC
jgi:hypothetical protein